MGGLWDYAVGRLVHFFPCLSDPGRRSALCLRVALVALHLIYVGVRFLFDRDLIDKTIQPWYTALYLLLFVATLVQYFLTACSSPGYVLDVMKVANERDALFRKATMTSKGKCIMNELEGLVKEVTGAMQTANESKSHLKDEVIGDLLGLTLEATSFVKEELVCSDSQGPKILEYAVMMCIIYNMVKKDYVIQEKILSSLNLNSSSGELESYKLMWSLRPFVDDEIMHRAWRVVA